MVAKLEQLKDFKIQYRYEVLLAFVILEVLFYDSTSIIQPVIALAEYLFVSIALVMSRRVGVMYFISFTLLSLGSWSYIIQTELPNSFWGIRLAGLSLNFFFSLFLCCYCLAFSSRLYRFEGTKLYVRFFYTFIIYCFFLGCVITLAGFNYPDNLLKDTSVYLPFFIYIYLLSILDEQSTLQIVKYGISLTICTMLISFVTGIMFQYSIDNYFLLMNSYAFIVVFVVFFLKKLYTRNHYIFLLITTVLLLATGKVFVGGKFIIITVFILIWLGMRKKVVFFSLCVLAILVIYNMGYIGRFLEDNFSESLIITHKFTQIIEIFEIIDIDLIASTNSSMGNIFAEGRTTFYYLWSNPFFFLFGKGMGGGIQDVFGYFRPLAGPDTGYTYNDVIRNDYFRMHLPIYEISIKAGLLGLVSYIMVLVRILKKNHILSFAFFILMFTVFFNSKEMMLLTLLFMRASSAYTNLIHEQ